MVKNWLSGCWKLGVAGLLVFGGAIASSRNCAIAQVTPDQSLGAESSVVTPTNVNGLPGDVIDGGVTRGANLFHSFEQFSIPALGEASFNNALDIQNIISRVTGESISNIDGLLRANGAANLFLLNPNGIVFGSNASLNIGGSFVGSTASAVNFADGTSFSATAPTTTPLLTVSVPLGLQFGQNPGSIVVQGTGYDLSVQEPTFSPIIRGSSSTGLRVSQGKTLALVGGNVDIEGGVLTAELGHIELGSVGGNGQVSLSPIPSGNTFSYQGVQRGNIRLSQQALADASGGGSIHVVGDRVSLTDGSKVLIQNQGVQRAGSISVNATESLSVSGTNPDARLQASVESETIGRESGADIAILTPQLVIQGGAVISARSRSPGKAGNVRVNAADSVRLIGFSPNNPTFSSTISAPAYSSGDAGDVTVSTGRLIGLNGGQISSATFGTGSGGDITVDALDSIELIGQTSRFTPSSLNAVTLNAGDGGNVTVNTSSLAIRDGGNVSSSTLATGNAGSVTINAKDVEVSGGSLRSPTPTFVGSSAPILAGSLQATFGLPPVPGGASGDVTINTDKLRITGGALVDVRNQGSGNAGTLRVNASSIFLDNLGGITAATASGVGGNISLEAENLQLSDNSAITASARGIGNGGNITVDTDTLVALENSDITANAEQSFGGRVSINAQGIFGTEFRLNPTPESDITATGGSPELSGTVEINNPDVDPSQGVVNLPAELVDISNSIAQGCPSDGENKFIITGRGGLPPNPKQVLSSNSVQVEWVELDTDALSRSSTKPATDSIIESANTQIVEANGWEINNKGEVILTATAPTSTLNIPWVPNSDCNALKPKS